MLVISLMRRVRRISILDRMPVEDLALPALDLRALARRAAVPAAVAAALVAAVLVLGGPLQTFADALRRALDADPVWVVAAAVFELLSFGGYIALLWLVGSRASRGSACARAPRSRSAAPPRPGCCPPPAPAARR